MENGTVTLRSRYLESYDAFVDALPAALQQQISAIRDVHAEAYRLIQEAESSTGESGSLHATDSGTLLAADSAQRDNAFERIRELDDLLEQRSVFVSKLLELVRSTVNRVDSNYQLFAQYKTGETEHVAAASTRNGRSSASVVQTAVRRRPPLLEGGRKREHASVSSVSTSRRAVTSKRAALRKGSSIHLTGTRRGNGHAERSGVGARANRGAKIGKTANDAVSKVDDDEDDDDEDEEPDEREVEEPEVHQEVDRRTTARDRRLSNLTRRAVRRPSAANGKRRSRLAEHEAGEDDSDREDPVASSKKERDLGDTSDQDAEEREPDADGEDESTKRSRRRSQSADESDSEEQPAARAEDTATRSASESDNDGASPPRRAAEPQASTRRTRNSHVEQPRATSSATGAKRNSAATRGAASRTKRSAAATGAAAQSFNPAEHFVIEPNEPTYCLCAQVSYGDMIMCDNASCSVEWFHFACVSLKTKPKGKWYCPLCRAEPNRSNVMRKRPTDKKS